MVPSKLRRPTYGTGQSQLGVLQVEVVQAMKEEGDRVEGRRKRKEIERKRKRKGGEREREASWGGELRLSRRRRKTQRGTQGGGSKRERWR